MELSKDEEYKMIKEELDWTKKAHEEKSFELGKAIARCQQAKFRYTTTYRAFEDFLQANPEFKDKANDNTN